MKKSSQPEALSEFELIRVKRLLDTSCRERCPIEVHDQFALEYRIDGVTVELIEMRVRFNCPGEWSEHRIARLKRTEACWQLYTFDRNGRPLPYAPLPDFTDFSRLLAEVGNDPLSIFFG